MTKATVDTVLRRAAVGSTFRKQWENQPDQALTEYENQLSEDEQAALKNVSSTILNSLSSLGEANATRRWYLPASFKELGGTVLSLLLIVLMGVVVQQVFTTLNSTPVAHQVGDQFQIVDPFTRAKELLSLFFPIFSAVVTFWLGVAVESRRADQNKVEAEQARQGEQQAREDEKQAQAERVGTRATAKAVLAQVRVATECAQAAVQDISAPREQGSAFERRGGERSGAAAAADATTGTMVASDPCGPILAAVETAEGQLQ